jgi:hypothetical protein
MKHYELLRPLLLQGLLENEVSDHCVDFKKWASSGNFIVRDIPTNKSILIEVNNEFSFHNMMAFDICRMAAASFETMQNIQKSSTLPKSIGWLAIKSYYAAFFSAHSIMRCFGYLCSQLERGHVAQLNSFGQAIGLSNQIQPEAGFFSGVYSQNNRNLQLKKMKNTHEDTWRTLVDCLNEVSQNVLNVTGLSTKKQQVSADISDLIVKITDNGRMTNGSYLSQFRNSVNYRHEHDSWYPYGKRSIKAEKIVSMMTTWDSQKDVSFHVWKESRESYDFFSACRDLVNLNLLLVQVLIANSTSNKNLYARWPEKLLRLCSVA